MSPKQRTNSQCQYQNASGQRCRMLIDEHHRPANGAARPTLCAYHAGRLKATVPAVDPEVLAAELLGDIDDFSTAGSVNLFLGNLAKQLARKRIARRDAVALAYISQLLLNSLPALERQHEADNKAEEEAEYAEAVNRYLQRTRDFAALRNQPSANNAPQQGADNAPRFVKRHVGFSA